MIDPAAEVTAWNAARKPGALIQWRSAGGAEFTNTGQTWTDAYLLGGVPTVRVSSGAFVPLADARLHPLSARLAELGKVEVHDLYFPPPSCDFCNVDTFHDGDGFRCPACNARWSSNGTDGVRKCVECGDNDADVTGEDRQPRCLCCAAEVMGGVLDATTPYECRRCETEVVGIGREHGAPWAKRLCGMCCDGDARQADMDRWRAERPAVSA
jgi:hypothetical protein